VSKRLGLAGSIFLMIAKSFWTALPKHGSSARLAASEPAAASALVE
jgi:hypothetical protein